MGMYPRHKGGGPGCGQGEEGEQVRRRLLATLSWVPGREREAPQLGVTLNHLLSSFPAHEWRLRHCPVQLKPFLCFPFLQNEVVTVSLFSKLSVAHHYSQPREERKNWVSWSHSFLGLEAEEEGMEALIYSSC